MLSSATPLVSEATHSKTGPNSPVVRCITGNPARLVQRLHEVSPRQILFAFLIGLLSQPGFAQLECRVPHPDGESIDGTVTDRNSGQTLHDGQVVALNPSGNYVDFHTHGAADGYCVVFTPNCQDWVTTEQRGVAKLVLESAIHSTSANFSYFYQSQVFPKDSSTVAKTLDSDSSNSTGPMPGMFIISPGTYSFRYTTVTLPTSCFIQPQNVVAKPITLSFTKWDNDKDLGKCRDGNGGPSQVGNPCSIGTGNKYQEETDYRSSTLPLTRHYNSLLTLNFGLGYAWMTPYHRRLEIVGNIIHVRRGDGRSEPFSLISGSWHGDADTALSLTQDATGFTLTVETGDAERYDLNGHIQSVQSPNGRTLTWSYDAQTNLLSSVADNFGHALGFAYGSDGLLHTVTLPGGGQIQYAYDANLNLTSATYPDSTVRQYLYENTSAGTNNQLTGTIDESGARYATYGYDTSGRVNLSQHAGGADKVSLSYGFGSTNVTDPLGVTRTYGYQTILARKKTISISGTSCSQCGGAKAVSYDANGNASSRTDFNNVQATFSYDLNRNLETSRTEASGTGRARTISTLWNPSWRLPSLITEPNRTTAYTYDGSSDLLTKTITDTGTTPNSSRVWTYTYDSYGRVLTEDGPRTDVSDVTTYTYYTCTTGYECGQVHTVTNAVGQTKTYTAYNAHGQPLAFTDANGVVTTLSYDARQRVTSRQVGAETTTFVYWPTGLLKKVIQPDGSYLLYSYDSAHRLTQISDGLGNAVDYTLDAMGNRTAENTYDLSNTLRRTHSRVFNTLNQLYQDVNAAGTAAVTTTFGYDNNGNQLSIAAPLSRTTGKTYDELNRLKQITDPAGGITQFGYNANDALTSVTDPRSLTTTYTYNGFGDLKTQVSPDSGTTTNTYDSAGDLSTSTDARGAVAAYAYDALNRATSASYSLSGTTDQTISFAYDAGTYGKGHLTGASDANHALTWNYDSLGRVTSKSQTINGVTAAVGQGYTNGNLTSLTTPSGQTISYGYNANHQVTSVSVNGSVVLSGVTYEPLGPINGWTWGNGTTSSRTYDADGKVSQISSAGTKAYSYDDAFRITAISDTSSGSANWSYGYDALDRITSGTSASVIRGWTYDANGNRLTETGSAPSTYAISSANNRIAAITGNLVRIYSYDSGGNTTSYGSVAATYNNAGRLKTLAQGGSTETVIYNALGQAIEKTGGSGGTVLYWYDEAGHLLGEYDGSGNLIEETVWLGDIPVATLRPNGTSVAVYYVHSDHLNTPRQVTRPADNVQMWTWFSDPFGTDAANANPSGSGAFLYNLRFPGQVFDGQAGLHYNIARDYDSAIGGYAESDSIGLAGGSYSTYAYANGNPLSNTDPLGLAAPSRPAPWPLTWPLDFPLNPGEQWRNNAYQQITDALESLIKACRRPTCQDHFQDCLKTALGSRPGSVEGESACLSCRNGCVAAGGEWPSSIPTTTRRRIRCDYKNSK